MFIRKKKVSGKVYYYLVENNRVGDKVRQKVVKYLGNSEKISSLILERAHG